MLWTDNDCYLVDWTFLVQIDWEGGVRELVGWVRNVVLMNVYLDLENPEGSGFWVGGYMNQGRKWGS
jgi:hypothetical protein